MEPLLVQASGANSGARVTLEGLVLTGLVMARWLLKAPHWVLYTDMTVQLVPSQRHAFTHTRIFSNWSLCGDLSCLGLNSFLSVHLAENQIM